MPKATSDDNEPDGSVRPESKKPKAMSGTKRAFLVVGVLIWGTIVASATISNNRSGAWDKVFASKSVSAPSVDIPNTPEPSSVIEAPAETPSSASLVDFQLSSKMKLEELLREPSSAEYSNVRAHLISKVGERPNYSFCGSVNAKNGFGGYSGSQRFVANPLIAIVEDGTPDFQQIWTMACVNAPDKGEIWF